MTERVCVCVGKYSVICSCRNRNLAVVVRLCPFTIIVMVVLSSLTTGSSQSNTVN